MSVEWNGYPERFSFSQALEISRQYLLLRTVILQKKSRWVPLLDDEDVLLARPQVSGYFESANCSLPVQNFSRPHVGYSSRIWPSTRIRIQTQFVS